MIAMSKKTLIIGGIAVAVFTVLATMAGLLPFWLAALVAGALWLKRGYGRAKNVIMPLMDKGVPATATVVKKLRASSPSRTIHITYAFETGSGTFKGRTEGFSQDLNHLAVGDNIEILYLPDQPKISAPERMVAQARQARDELSARAARGVAKE